ncbi:MAG: hypothetical protein P4L31_04900 [Candidatus Babeliales bacterium]|nr:hypothetical protein [Candidatus Babeliales bacterium]
MNHKMLFLIATCIQQHTYAAVTIKAPIATTVPLRAKVYGINNAQTFRIQESEKPTLFKPFDAMITNYSWKYISKVRPNELGYVLVGYDDKIAARESGAALFDPARSQLPEPAPDASAVASSEALAKGEASGKEEVVAAPASAATNPAQAAPAPQAAIPSTTTAPQIEKKSPKGTGGSPRNVKAPMKTIKHEIDIPQSQHQKQLLLDIQVMCTNIPGVPLRKKQIEDSIKGGKVYGSSFDLKGHKQCYIVAKKYKDDAPAPEIQECIEKIYGGVLGVGGALEL